MTGAMPLMRQKIEKELGWQPKYRFEDALEKTVDWYMNNMEWIDSVRSGEYRKWIELNYQGRTNIAKKN